MPIRRDLVEKVALYSLFASFAAFQIYTSFFGLLEPLIQRSLFVGFGMGAVFLLSYAAASRDGRRRPWHDILLAAAGFYVCLHIALNNDRLSDFMQDLTTWDMLLGFVAVAVLLEAARRVIGWFLPGLALIGLVYYYCGHSVIGGTWQPPRVSDYTAVQTMYASTEAIFGYMADIGTRVISIFIIFGSLLLSTGATSVFMKTATAVAGRSYGGPAKVCTISSALFGTVTGSAVANVMAVGSVTIPTMKRLGYPAAFAGAVEAVASAGGQIMPPVMGAGAFIMAETLGISYGGIALAAAIPALLYYLSLWFGVSMAARRHNLAPVPREEIPSPREYLEPYAAIPMYVPMILLGVLLALDYTPTLAGAAAVVALIAAQLVMRVLRCLIERRVGDIGAVVVGLARETVEGLYDAGKAIAIVAVLLACAALVVKVLTATGIGVKISAYILSFSGESLVMVLVLTALLSIALGMDVPTTASYILASAVSAPILVKLGIPALHAHLFVFYYAILSAITPPVCASVYAAAVIAEVSFWRVAGQALLLAVGIYIIPFLFIFRTGVLFEGSGVEIIYDVLVCCLAIYSISAASAGFLRDRLSWPLRVALYAAGAVLFYPAPASDAVGLVMVAAVWGWQTHAARQRGGQPGAPAKVGHAVRSDANP